MDSWWRAVLIGVVGLTEICIVQCYQSGAPKDACHSMEPNHSAFTQNNLPPYELVLPSNGCFKEGQRIELTFKKTGLQDFKGLLIEARKAKDPYQNVQLGTYNVGNSSLKLLQCSPNHNSAVTHKDGTDKSSETFTWTAPSDLRADVVFRFTVVQSLYVFWEKQDSAKLEYHADCTAGASALFASFLTLVLAVFFTTSSSADD